jgi:predicted glutamine amidotransferase
MCGIAGFIGHPKKPKLSYELLTCLFDELEVRGIDAAGFWATEMGQKVLYHKEPVKSSEFIKRDYWKKLGKYNIDMALVHSRATSKGGGAASTNSNNHPFVSNDLSLAMIHNGTLDEASFLKEKYETLSQTDSEYILRIYEHGLDKPYYSIEGIPDDVAKKVNGIKDVWSYISTGAMAVAIGERIDRHKRGLFLFRNEKRPIWLADLRRVLGQVFFFSSPDIWYRAVCDKENLKKACWGEQKLVELPPNQIWYMRIDKEDPIVTEENIFKLGVSPTGTVREWDKGDFCSVRSSKESTGIEVVANEDFYNKKKREQEKVIPVSNLIYKKKQKKCEKEDFWDSPRVNHAQICDEISRLSQQIDTVATNMSLEGSFTPNDYQMLLESLEQIKSDMQGTLRIIDPL